MEKESKIRTKFSLIDSIILLSYYLFCLLLFLGLTGLFRKELIALGMSAGFLFWLWAGMKIELKKYYLYFFFLIPALLVGVLLIKGSFNGDGINYWLPWSREIVLQERMPDFLLNSRGWLTSRMPLMPLFYAGIFSFLGFQDWVIAILPLFFTAATVFLLYRWLLEKGVVKNYIILGTLILITNSLFLNLGGEAAQEPFILFFFTAFFYYLEKTQETKRPLYFLLAVLSAILAAVSKETGLILLLPLGWFAVGLIKNKQILKPYYYVLLVFPLLLWLFRNYLLYDNPIFSFFNEIFRGRYYDLVLAVDHFQQSFNSLSGSGILNRIIEVPISLFLLFCPLVVLSFYGFWKKRKTQYLLLFFIFLLSNFLITVDSDYVRYLMPFLALFIVYAVMGLEEMNSRMFLSLIFFLNLWGLLSTKLSLSQSQLISPLERILSGFGQVAQFFYDYRVIAALGFGILFFFSISAHRQAAKILILLLVSTYLVKTESFQLGSWLNIWPPILGSVFIVLIWRRLLKLKEETLRKLIVAYVVILLMLNSWGLAAVNFWTHGNLVFPNFAEAYGAQPEVAREIEKLEGTSRDFYVLAATATYFTWYHNFKTTQLGGYNFYIITNLEYNDNLNPSKIHSLFQRSNIKYVVENHSRTQLKPFFDKIKSRPDLFELLFQKEGVYLWRTK